MKKILQAVQFLSWPIVCGILLALVVLQYQQLDQLRQQPATTTPSTAPALPASVAAPLSFAPAIAKASASVVSINATSVGVESIERAAEDRLNFYLGERTSLGSGVVVDPRGFVLTNFHVVDTLFDAFDAEVTLNDGRSNPATVVAWDQRNDLAILHINMGNLTPIERGDAAALNVGDIVFAIGYPRNIGQAASQGIVSALNRQEEGELSVIQTDAAINPGNSGGALINLDGKLVGINSSIFSESGTFEGIGFATPVNLALEAAMDMIDQAIEGNSGYLGVLTGEALNAESSELFFGVEHIRGMLVESVDRGGAAEQAGIRPGDVITAVEDSRVTDGENIMTEIRNKKPGETISVEVFRDGQTLRFPTTLGFGQAIVIEL